MNIVVVSFRTFDWQTGQMRVIDVTGIAGNSHNTELRTLTYTGPLVKT
jgi:hypothetical protein